MSAFATSCSRSSALPVDLLHKEDHSARILCGCVTNKHKQHHDSPWCAEREYLVGPDYVLRLVRIYLDYKSAELAIGTNQERDRLLEPVYAWVTWYRVGPEKPPPIYVAGVNTYISQITANGKEIYNLPPVPPPNLVNEVREMQKMARKNKVIDAATVSGVFGRISAGLHVEKRLNKIETDVGGLQTDVDFLLQRQAEREAERATDMQGRSGASGAIDATTTAPPPSRHAERHSAISQIVRRLPSPSPRLQCPVPLPPPLPLPPRLLPSPLPPPSPPPPSPPPLSPPSPLPPLPSPPSPLPPPSSLRTLRSPSRRLHRPHLSAPTTSSACSASMRTT